MLLSVVVLFQKKKVKKKKNKKTFIYFFDCFVSLTSIATATFCLTLYLSFFPYFFLSLFLPSSQRLVFFETIKKRATLLRCSSLLFSNGMISPFLPPPSSNLLLKYGGKGRGKENLFKRFTVQVYAIYFKAD